MLTSDLKKAFAICKAYKMNFNFKSTKPYIAPILAGFSAVLVTLFLFLSLPIYIFRLVVILLAKLFRPDLGDILSGVSSIFSNDLFTGKRLRSNVVISHTFEGRFTLDELKALVWKNWIHAVDPQTGQLLYTKFRQYPVKWLGFTFYKKAVDTFDIDNHVHCHDNLGGGGGSSSDEDVMDFTEMLLNRSFKPRTPLWEVHLVQNYHDPRTGAGELSTILIKLHHSLADGYSMLQCGKALMEFSLDESKMPSPRPLPKRSKLAQFLCALSFPFKSFYEVCFFLSQSFRSSPWKVEDGQKEYYQYLSQSEPISVKAVAEIKNGFGVTFTSVLVSALSSAISQNFVDKLEKKEMEWEEDYNSLYFFNTLPIMGPKKSLTNQMTGSMFHLPTTIFPDSLSRLRACYKILEDGRTSVMPYVGMHISMFAGAHFTSVGSQLLRNRSVSIGLTNFPSLPIKMARNGRPLVRGDVAVGCNEGCAGVGIMMLSYGGSIRVAITAEKSVMTKDETQSFLKSIEKEIDILHGKALALAKIA